MHEAYPLDVFLCALTNRILQPEAYTPERLRQIAHAMLRDRQTLRPGAAVPGASLFAARQQNRITRSHRNGRSARSIASRDRYW